jgi:hypothetical protein
MRAFLLTLLSVAWLLPECALGQGANPYLTVAIKPGTVASGEAATVQIQCPAGSIPVGYSLKSKHAGKVVAAAIRMLDNNGNIVDLSTLVDGSSLVGGGGEGLRRGRLRPQQRDVVRVAVTGASASIR